jgi:opacity protein-like surface antigen
MKKILFLTLSLILAYSSAFASFDPSSAPTIDPIDLNPITLGTEIPIYQTGIIGEFYHKYTMTLPDSDFAAAVVSVSFAPYSYINDFKGYLFKDNGENSFTKIFELTGAALIDTQFNLLAGDYFLALTGVGFAQKPFSGGAYTGFISATSSVPVPGAALLLGSGLLGLVGLRRRQIV